MSIAVGEAGIAYVEALQDLRGRLDEDDPTIRDYRISEALQWLRYVSLDLQAVRDDAAWAKHHLSLIDGRV